jgi:hypothetical protein
MVKARQWKELVDLPITTPPTPSKQADIEYQYYQRKYNIDQYDELPFCIVVPTFNNAKKSRHLRNIKSVIMQNYTNFHVVVIDDASDDGTGD